jgi:hypothetical protein
MIIVAKLLTIPFNNTNPNGKMIILVKTINTHFIFAPHLTCSCFATDVRTAIDNNNAHPRVEKRTILNIQVNTGLLTFHSREFPLLPKIILPKSAVDIQLKTQ